MRYFSKSTQARCDYLSFPEPEVSLRLRSSLSRTTWVAATPSAITTTWQRAKRRIPKQMQAPPPPRGVHAPPQGPGPARASTTTGVTIHPSATTAELRRTRRPVHSCTASTAAAWTSLRTTRTWCAAWASPSSPGSYARRYTPRLTSTATRSLSPTGAISVFYPDKDHSLELHQHSRNMSR